MKRYIITLNKSLYIYRTILTVLCMIAMAACGGGTPKNTNNNVQQNTIHTRAGLPLTPLVCPSDQSSGSSSSFVSSVGTELAYQGSPLKLYGATFYPAPIGGSSAWRKPDFTHYIDHILYLEAQAGQNLIRPTDFWDQHYHEQAQEDATIWRNMDYLVCTARQQGIFVILDVSAFKWFLISQKLDPYNAANWETFLDAVGKHYSNQPSIAFYSISGEPAAPKSVDEMNKLVEFYRTATDDLHRADGGHHLITAGGLNHMEDETQQIPWWQQIYLLPNNNILAFKTYSQNDLNLLPTIAAFAKGINKPLVDEEFGLPQQMGDGETTGAVYNGLQTSRVQFYEDVYNLGEENGVVGFVFWDLGCQLKDSSYQVSPLTPALWRVIQEHAPNKPTTPSPAISAC